MDNLRFVLESPQLNQTHKKRPRLVTSCDNCRLKKIKCVQTKSHKCEACESTNVPCEFRDRERYFAERSRIVTGASAGSSGHSPRRSSTPAAGRSEGLVYTASPEPHSRSSSESHAWYSSGVPASGVDLAQQSRYASTSPAPYASSQPAPDAWFPHDSTGVQQRSTHGYVASPLGEPAQYSHQALPSGLPQDPYHLRFPNHRDTQLSSLFDPRQPGFPNPTLMGYLMPLFFERFERNFAFLRPEEVSRRHYNGSLSPALASSIAALGSRYSQHQDVLSRGTSVVCDAYSSNAKRLLSASSHYPYLEILHAVILIAWGEYKNGRTAGCYEYSQMAMKMALSMGLSSDNVARSAGDGDQAIYRATWASVAQLQQLTST